MRSIQGNLLPVIEGHIGPLPDADALKNACDWGDLSRFLPEKCWWMVIADQNGQLQSLEQVPTAIETKIARPVR
jgi:hypothetical protein